MANAADMASQKADTDAKLNTLPVAQRGQIEQAVSTYRGTLVSGGASANDVQTRVWEYYVKCVGMFHQEYTKTTTPAVPAPPPAPPPPPAAPQASGAGNAGGADNQALAGVAAAAAQSGQLGSALSWNTQKLPARPSAWGKGGWQMMGGGMQGMGMGTSPSASSSTAGDGSGGGGGNAEGSGTGGEAGQGDQNGQQNQQGQNASGDGAGNSKGNNMGNMGNMGMKGGGKGWKGWKGWGGWGGWGWDDGGGMGMMGSGLWGKGISFGIKAQRPGLLKGGLQGFDGCGKAGKGGMGGQGWGQGPRVIAPPGAVGVQGGLPAAFAKGGFGSGRPIRPGLVQIAGQTVAGVGAAGVGAGGAGGGGAKGGNSSQFPPMLQTYLQRLFTTAQQTGDAQVQQKVHEYAKSWVNTWVKSGDIWKISWESAPLPTKEEILGNLAPGTKSGKAIGRGAMGGMGAGFSGGFSGGASGSAGWNDKRRLGSKRSRSRSGYRRRRSRSRRRRRRSGSRSRSRDRSSSRSRSKSGDGEADWGMGMGKWGAKGKGKKGKDGDTAWPTPQEMRLKVHNYLLGKMKEGLGARPKELQDDLQLKFNCNLRRFRMLMNQTLPQYIAAYNTKGEAGPAEYWSGKNMAKGMMMSDGWGPGLLGSGNLAQNEWEMRQKRASRFQAHLQVEKQHVAMVSFNDREGGSLHGGPIIGGLNEMCSKEEAREREQTRQLDKMEWKKGTDPKCPEVNFQIAVKKYQRSSADKAYRSQDVRSLDACWRTVEYLMTEILDFDINPKPQFAMQHVKYVEVYSFLRDRTRALRVDLHLQQPRSTTQRCFIETHECCLRFEMLTIFLLNRLEGSKKADGATEKYDPKLGLKAISQTIEPLLHAYQAVRDKLMAKQILAEVMGDLGVPADDDEEYSSAWEPAVHRYIALMLMSFAPEELMTHLAKLEKVVLAHPLVSFATQVHAAFSTDDYGHFLKCYRETDFLSAVAMSGIADLARLRALWMLYRTYPQPIGDKISLPRICNLLAFATESHARKFLVFHGVNVVDVRGGTSHIVLPKKGTPEAAAHPLLSGASRLPEKCEFPKGPDSMLEAKFEALGLSRTNIVFGAADPVLTVPVPEEEAILADESMMVDGEAAEAAEGGVTVAAAAEQEAPAAAAPDAPAAQADAGPAEPASQPAPASETPAPEADTKEADAEKT
eukprot:TRINITY_DN2985_c0_g1_i1.p1 TRINITY_DN2985_c0_g1~~TRINITY_DN2985_c0_g1_i1.p1  ORF type:complete len:1183 (+),score=328.16 TRINITY_DN2985_c0_g1_i1:152-3700(+)